MRLPLWVGLVLVVVVAGAALGDGPETGVVTGSTTDAEGSPLPGVLVTLSGDRGDQVVVAGADGSFRFALLPPGSYKVSGQLEGFPLGDPGTRAAATRRDERDQPTGPGRCRALC